MPHLISNFFPSGLNHPPMYNRPYRVSLDHPSQSSLNPICIDIGSSRQQAVLRGHLGAPLPIWCCWWNVVTQQSHLDQFNSKANYTNCTLYEVQSCCNNFFSGSLAWGCFMSKTILLLCLVQYGRPSSQSDCSLSIYCLTITPCMWMILSTISPLCGCQRVILNCPISNNLHVSVTYQLTKSLCWSECNDLGTPQLVKTCFINSLATVFALWSASGMIISFVPLTN